MELLLGETEVSIATSHKHRISWCILSNVQINMQIYVLCRSVTWVIEDLMLEYAAQIVQHMNKLATEIEHNHWRTNPSVLSGMRVAVFRKGSNPLPTIVTGYGTAYVDNSLYSSFHCPFCCNC